MIIVKLNQFKHPFHANTNRHAETNSLDIMAYILSFTESSKREWLSRTASHFSRLYGRTEVVLENVTLSSVLRTHIFCHHYANIFQHICWCISKWMPHVIFKESCLCNQREKLYSHYYKTIPDCASEIFCLFLAISQYLSPVMTISVTVIRPQVITLASSTTSPLQVWYYFYT